MEAGQRCCVSSNCFENGKGREIGSMEGSQNKSDQV